MILESFETGPMACNCSIIGCPITREALVVDPGGDADKIIERVKALGLNVRQILITHGHFDHVLAAREVQKATGAKISIHHKDAWLYRLTPVQTKLFGGSFSPRPPRPNRWLCEGDVVETGSVSAKVMHTPGHSPGACCFHFAGNGLLLSGDTLFAGSIGQWRFPGGSIEQIFASLDRLMTLPDETKVIPGHGPHTTIGEERRNNPYLDENRRSLLRREDAERPGLFKSILLMLAHLVGFRRKS